MYIFHFPQGPLLPFTSFKLLPDLSADLVTWNFSVYHYSFLPLLVDIYLDIYERDIRM